MNSARDKELLHQLQAVIFASQEFIALSEMVELVNEPAEDIERVLKQYATELKNEGAGFQLVRRALGYRFEIHQQYVDLSIRRNPARSAKPITQTSRETFMVIASHQPVSLAEITRVRGRDSYYPLQTLKKRGMIARVNQTDSRGNPMWCVTKEGLAMYNVRTVQELIENSRLGAEKRAEESEDGAI